MERASATPSADQAERSREGVPDRNWSLGFEEDEVRVIWNNLYLSI
jgi:hypothetical protein